ncbi:MAG: ferrous iron transport protein A [Coriobacteriaceae bacterium]|nr:ferrous iron transport protein A [Coriobacteriaceae bacterium]
MKTLGDVAVGGSSTIIKLHGSGALRRHLMDMGLIKGTPFNVVKVAPLGDPIEITVRGYELSIRKEEAAIVEVE